MRHPTKHYKRLKRSLAQARKITARVPENGSTSALHHLKVQSFILLSHAAIEEYLEELGRDVARQARQRLQSQQRITRSLVALIASKLLDDAALSKSKKQQTADLISNLNIFSHEAANLYEKLVKDNHGILERNQKNILCPIGVDPETVDTALIDALHAYGKQRGDIAHSFAMIRTEYTLGGVTADLEAIVKALAAYDEAACDALNKAI